MENLEMSNEKLCSFYVSDWHLVTMILPYINKKINEKANIITVLENNIEENIKTILTKLNLKNEEKILEIDWKSVDGKKYTEVSEKISKKLKKENVQNIILVNGTKNYIDIVNSNIERVLKKFKDANIKIIDCYEVTDFNGNIREILDKHNRILNTAGEKEISDVFEGYSDIDSEKEAL